MDAGQQNERIDTAVKIAIEFYPHAPERMQPVIEYYYPRLRRYIVSYTRDQNLADDIVQNTMIRMYRFLKDFKFKSSFSSWLYRIAYNEMLRFQQKKQIDMDENAQIENLGAEQLAVSSSVNEELNYRQSAVLSVLDELRKRDGDVLRLYYYEGFSVIEISMVLNIGESAVKMRLTRARDKFARLWNEKKYRI